MATLWVLTERGTTAEAVEAREIFGKDAVIGTASAHAPGQRLYGDVVVIGGAAQTVEQDATGTVRRYVSLATARSGVSRAAAPPAEPKKPEEAPKPEPAKPSQSASAPKPPEPKAAPQATPASNPEHRRTTAGREPEPEPADELDGMSRVDLIQHGAKEYPGRRRWATLSDSDLRAALRELGAKR